MRVFDSVTDAAIDKRRPDFSLIVPVFNGGPTIGWLVDQAHADFDGADFEIILVNDGSADYSEGACTLLVEKYPDSVRYVHLARNYGEHTAVLAGLRQARGRFVAVLDDDGQNPPYEARRMLEHAAAQGLDVVYGRYEFRKHLLLRRLGSWCNDRAAGLVLDKPRDIHLSSFKVMSRMVVDEVVKYDSKFPYLDGMIFRITRNIGQLTVTHLERRAGRSGYNLRKHVALWLNMLLGFSMAPLRAALAVGGALSAIGMFALALIVARAWADPSSGIGLLSLLSCVSLFAAGQFLMAAALGEYLGRTYLQQNATPQYVVRYVLRGNTADDPQRETQQLTGQTAIWPVY
jgi:glycosyltransferase involved in cell wall biosynthesis